VTINKNVEKWWAHNPLFLSFFCFLIKKTTSLWKIWVVFFFNYVGVQIHFCYSRARFGRLALRLLNWVTHPFISQSRRTPAPIFLLLFLLFNTGRRCVFNVFGGALFLYPAVRARSSSGSRLPPCRSFLEHITNLKHHREETTLTPQNAFLNTTVNESSGYAIPKNNKKPPDIPLRLYWCWHPSVRSAYINTSKNQTERLRRTN